MTVYLLRHGQSVANAASLFSGVSDHALTELGREQARQAGNQFQGHSFSYLFTSQLSRAVETANLFLESSGAKVGERQTRAELNERNFGIFEGKREHKEAGPEKDALWQVCQDVNFVPEQGESMRQTHSRAINFLDEVACKKPGDVLIIAHGNVLRSMTLHALGWPIEMLPQMPSRNCLVTRLHCQSTTPD